MKRARASSRREEILAATVDLVTERGHQKVRVADVAEKLGVSASLIIYHFTTKEELVAQAFRFAADNDLVKARRIAVTIKDPLERFVSLARWYAPTETSRSWALWIDGWSAGMRNQRLAQMLATVDDEWKQLMIQAVHEARESGQIRDVDAHDATVRVMAFADGLAVARMMGTAELAVTTIADWIETFARAELV